MKPDGVMKTNKPEQGRRDFLRSAIGALGAAGITYKGQEYYKNRKTIKQKGKDLQQQAENKKEKPDLVFILNKKIEEFNGKITEPTYRKSVAARKILEVINHPLNEKGEDRNMSLCVEIEGSMKTITMPILRNEETIIVNGETKHGRLITINNVKYFLINDFIEGKDHGVSRILKITPQLQSSNPDPVIMATKRAPYNKNTETFKPNAVIYTPPSKEMIKSKDIRKTGLDFTAFVAIEAIKLIKNIIEERIPERELQLISKIVMRLMIIEHIDPTIYHKEKQHKEAIRNGDIKKQKVLEKYTGLDFNFLLSKVLTEYGLNTGKAFGHLDNNVGAMGPLQIIPSTLDLIYKISIGGKQVREILKSYGLNTDDPNVRSNPILSFALSIILCHANYLTLKRNFKGKKYGDRFFGERIEDYEELIVANHNGSLRLIKTTLSDAEDANNKTPFPEVYKNLATRKQMGNNIPGTKVPENVNYINKYLELKALGI